jgi:hypothetical protein
VTLFSNAVAARLPVFELAPAQRESVSREDEALQCEIAAIEAAESAESGGPSPSPSPSRRHGDAELADEIVHDQMLPIALDQASAEVADLAREIKIRRSRCTGGARAESPQFGERIAELVAELSQPASPAVNQAAQFEERLARLNAENEVIASERMEIEGKRPLTMDDELRVLLLHAVAEEERKGSEGKGREAARQARGRTAL